LGSREWFCFGAAGKKRVGENGYGLQGRTRKTGDRSADPQKRVRGIKNNTDMRKRNQKNKRRKGRNTIASCSGGLRHKITSQRTEKKTEREWAPAARTEQIRKKKNRKLSEKRGHLEKIGVWEQIFGVLERESSKKR